jgi:hypothetical protein
MEDCHFSTTKNIRQSRSGVKTKLLTFIDIRGIVYFKFVPTGQTVNQVYGLEVLGRLHEKLDGNDPNLLPTPHGSCITTMHCSHGTVCEGGFSYYTNNCVETPCLFNGSSHQ